MKITNLFLLSALVPFFALMSAVIPPEDTAVRMNHLRFAPVVEDIGDMGATKSLFLIRNRAQYEQLFGERRTIDIDFENEWACFYSAGWMPTTGYDARVLDVGYMPDASTLVFTTQLVSPGRNCVLAPMLTKPFALVKFPRPARTIDIVRFVADDIWVDCGR
jgi:hypothetical protein